MIIIIIQICYCMENEDNEARKLLTKIGNKRKAGDQTKENEKEKAAANILVQISKKKDQKKKYKSLRIRALNHQDVLKD
ncbi:hypothetical protein ACQ4LE_009529 [Meloidogyne hapla]